MPALHDGIEDHHVGHASQLRELEEPLFLLLDTPRRDPYQDRPLAPIGTIELPALPGEIVLELGDEIDEVHVDLARRRGIHELPGIGPGVAVRRGREIGGADEPGEAVFTRLDRRHRIEAEQNQIRQVVPRQRLLAEMGVEAAKPAEPPLRHALPLQVGKDDLPRVADSDPLDFALAVDQDPHLAPDVSRDLRELAGELLGDEGAGRKPPLVELLEPVPLSRASDRLHCLRAGEWTPLQCISAAGPHPRGLKNPRPIRAGLAPLAQAADAFLRSLLSS